MIHAFWGFGGTIITPGIARNETFAVSITVDCRIHLYQKAHGRGSKGKSGAYI